ncbi:TorF family putative porin [Gilvimarinus xylanilyticus]|uniref:TorF family putative porin n=1 Tax=Gilvimarinus xylanilyticus TaxID=2944139 RepID=A0A9X2KTP5_9GAMM|nr:TorF family putative porin [Gilvimarinus xylanilyticus]MCP8899412.1 TorF family putative porin [Gilvimarinus xylanilyticus]
MKMMNKKVLASAVAASAIALSAVAPSASAAEVSASVGAANMYYWRGMDLGAGDAAISGDLSVSAGGFYGGLWGSSGDAALGTEYDIYAGYGAEMGDFRFDVSAWSYVYPETDTNPGDLMEVVASVGFGPVDFTYYDNIEGDEDYWYATAAVTMGDFGLLYGQHDFTDGTEYSHVDLSYAFNDNLSFTVGVPVEDEGGPNDNAKFIVSLSLPIEF